MGVSTDVGRDIFDAREVLKQQLTNLIVEKAMGSGLDKSKCQDLSVAIAGTVDVMFDGLVSRVTNKIESTT
jgi:hypothetical protein